MKNPVTQFRDRLSFRFRTAKSLVLVGALVGIASVAAMNEGLAAPETSTWSNTPSYPSTYPSYGNSNKNRGKSTYSRERERESVAPFSPGSHNVALELGQAFLMGDLGDHYTDSILYQVHYTYGVSDIFGFESSFGYSDHSDGKFSMTSLVTGLRTNLAWFDKVVPYGILGLGFYRPSRQVTATNSVSAALFGVHLGAGVSLALTKELFFGAGITFHDVFGTTKKTSAGDIDLGGTYTSFLLHAGMSF